MSNPSNAGEEPSTSNKIQTPSPSNHAKVDGISASNNVEDENFEETGPGFEVRKDMKVARSQPAEHINLDDDGIIDYSDEEVLAGNSSAGSSTLQGDVNDSTPKISTFTQESIAESSKDTKQTFQAPADFADESYNPEQDQFGFDGHTDLGGNKEYDLDSNTIGAENLPSEDKEEVSSNALGVDSPEADRDEAKVSHVKEHFEEVREIEESGDRNEPSLAAHDGNGEIDLHSDPTFDTAYDKGQSFGHELGQESSELGARATELEGEHQRASEMTRQSPNGGDSEDKNSQPSTQAHATTGRAKLMLDEADEITFDDGDDFNKAFRIPEEVSQATASPRTLKRTHSSQEDGPQMIGKSSGKSRQ